MPNQQITISTVLKAPVERAWQAYTAPAEITQWNFASDDWCCPSADVDLRVGGAYRARMEAKNGSFGFDFAAVYGEVDPYKAITLTMNEGRKARTTFESIGEGTRVTTTFDAEEQNSLEMQRNGWQAILDNFRKYVER